MRFHREVSLDAAAITRLETASVFDYSRIQERFRLGSSADAVVTIYKGAQIGRERVGFFSEAVEEHLLQRVEEARNTVERGNEEEIRALLEYHTWANPCSAFLSTSANPEAAQVFAPSGNRFTIYKLEIPANRCLLDGFDTGNVGASGEVLVLGLIHPGEITAYKIRNQLPDSELRYTTSEGLNLIRDSQDPASRNTEVKDRANWRSVASSIPC